MQKKWLAVAVTTAILAGTVGVVQAETKIGVVNTEVILRDSPAAQAASKKLENEFAKRDKDINAQGRRLKSDIEKFEQNAGTMNEQERVRKQRDLQDRDRDFQRRQRELREDFNQRRNEELQKLLRQANTVIKNIAQREKFDLILQEAIYARPEGRYYGQSPQRNEVNSLGADFGLLVFFIWHGSTGLCLFYKGSL